MKKIILMLILTGTFSSFTFAKALSGEELQNNGIIGLEEYTNKFKKEGILDEYIFNKTIKNFEKSLELFSSQNDSYNMMVSEIKIADIYNIGKQPIKAYKIYLNLLHKVKDIKHKVYILLGMVKIERNEFKKYGLAKEHILEALLLIKEVEDKQLYLNILDQKAQLELELNNWISAYETISEALSIVQRGKVEYKSLWSLYFSSADINTHITWMCDRNHDFFLECKNSTERAKQDYNKALILVEEMKWNFIAKHIKINLETLIAFQNRVNDKYEKSIETWRTDKVYQKLIHPKDASDVMVRYNNFVLPLTYDEEFLNELNQTIYFANKNNPRTLFLKGDYFSYKGKKKEALRFYLRAVRLLDEERSDIRDIFDKRNLLEDKMEFYSTPMLYLLDINQTEKAFDLLEQSRNRILSELLEDQNYTILKNQLSKDLVIYPSSLKDVQKQLAKEDTEILEYLVLEEQIIIWHIKKDDVNTISVSQPRIELNKKIRSVDGNLSSEDNNKIFLTKEPKELFLLLINPIIKDIESKRLVIVPHHELNQLPFQVLINPETNQSLGETFQISYAPSASIWTNLKSIKNLKDRNLLAIGEPTMTKGLEEIDYISSFYPNSHTKIVKDIVTKDEFYKSIKGHNIVHLSLHGKYLASSPMMSYIELPPKQNKDGYVTASEMFGLPLEKNSLVVLSACETGRVKTTQSNETLGIVRGLLYAGADAVLLSSWKVDEEATALWMKTFYKVAQTENLAEASRQAMIKVKSVPKFNHPRYWSGFSLIMK